MAKVQELVQWIGRSTWRESAFANPHPQWLLDSHDTLDKISELWGYSKEQIGIWVEEGKQDEETQNDECKAPEYQI